MANEARIQAGLQIRGPLSQQYQSAPAIFTADVHLAGGPTPGEFLASKSGTDVNLSALTQPGWCWLFNLGVDASGNDLAGTAGDEFNWTNYVEYGLKDHTTGNFYPLGELLPGEATVVRLSRFIGLEIGTGAGTTPGADAVKMQVKSIGTASKVIVNAFER